MVPERSLKSGDVCIRELSLDDCGPVYLSWLNDPEINCFLETRWNSQTLSSIKEFVTFVRSSPDSVIFAIEYNGNHVGNIKLGFIHSLYKYADLSYFIGDKKAWGKGVATKAIGLALAYAFEALNLQRVQAGAYEENIGSSKVLLKNGFIYEGVSRKKCFLSDPNNYTNVNHYAILQNEWRARHQPPHVI